MEYIQHSSHRSRAVIWLLTGIACFAALPALSFAEMQQGDVSAGQAKAALCAACHGLAGVSINPLWPSLAGQQAQYLSKQIRHFRDGEREEPTMQPFVQHLSDQDIEDLAAYYASLSPCP